MSIQTVGAKGFKGLPDFETKLERLTLLVGPNGAGKTARAHALQLAILGFVPGLAKTNRDIMATFGNGEKLVVEVRRDGVRCSRGYFQDKDGKVTEKFQLDLKRATRDQYAVAMGGVKLFDLGAFHKLSDQGKIDLVFSLFPPGEGYRELEDQIEAKKAERNTLQKEMESLQATAARLHQRRATIELPAGTLAEIKSQIQEAEQQLRMATEALHQQNVAVAQAKATEQAELAASRRAETEKIERERQAERERCKVAEQQRIDQARLAAQEKLNAEMAEKLRRQAELQAEREKMIADIDEAVPGVRDGMFIAHSVSTPSAMACITAILDTMQRTGCSACAAALVCRRELKKLREVV
jgi:DNA repair exonuclease SbcCD ATPase subunit